MGSKMMADELSMNKKAIRQSSTKIYGRARFAQSSSHTNSWLSGSNGDSHHDKASFRLIKTTQIKKSQN
jgi:hypothetical protein